ncbi:MAG: AAA family ATPase [Janthinobacterium lividum]
MSVLPLAFTAETLGLPVFPCGLDKAPVCAKGFKDATTDPAAIHRLFKRPGAALIGVPTGRRSGFVVIDVDVEEDPAKDGRTWLDGIEGDLPRTRRHATRSGGSHLLFLVPEGVELKNTQSKIAPGVDFRCDGGYIIHPPSDGYTVEDDAEPAEMPGWLVDACRPPAPLPVPALATLPRSEVIGSAYGRKALDEECEAIRTASFGTQEDTLNKAALKIGGLVAGGELAESEAQAELMTAARSMASQPGRDPWTERSLDTKVRKGLADGARNPRTRPGPETRAEHGGSAGTAVQLPPPVAPKGLHFLPMDDLAPILGTAGFVRGLLADGAMSVLYGESGTGKSFVVLDLAMHVALGWPWRGRETEQGSVLYVAAEGGHGMKNRVVALRQHLAPPPGTPFGLVPCPVDLLDPNGDTEPLVALARRAANHFGQPLKLIVVDTLSRAIAGGDENSPQAMGAFVRNIDMIREATGAHVLVVHHSGKDDARGARGHSLLRAAADTELKVTNNADATGVSTLQVTKQKDLPTEGTFHSRLVTVVLGYTEAGDEITSCVLEEITLAGQRMGKRSRMAPLQSRAMELLQSAILAEPETPTPCDQIPSGVAATLIATWREHCYRGSLSSSEQQDSRKKAFQRAFTSLQAGGLIEVWDEWVWPAEKPGKPV